jgi:hypothetical protein
MTQTTLPAHWYVVETVQNGLRYAGPDFDSAVAAVLSLGDSEEGYAVAETNGAYDPAESNRVETAALAESDRLDDPHAGAPQFDSAFYEDN